MESAGPEKDRRFFTSRFCLNRHAYMPSKSLIIACLRRLWLMSKERSQALSSARKQRGRYQCAHCGFLFKRKEVQVDHVIPIGSTTSWDDYIFKLFCPVDNLQILCVEHHKAKSAADKKISVDKTA